MVCSIPTSGRFSPYAVTSSLPITSDMECSPPTATCTSMRASTSSLVTPSRSSNKPPRPPNSFIIYRTEHAAKYPKLTAAELSKILGSRWSQETPECKAHYAKLAKKAEIEHAAQYPEYKFTPAKRGTGKKARAMRAAGIASTRISSGRDMNPIRRRQALCHSSSTQDLHLSANTGALVQAVRPFGSVRVRDQQHSVTLDQRSSTQYIDASASQSQFIYPTMSPMSTPELGLVSESKTYSTTSISIPTTSSIFFDNSTRPWSDLLSTAFIPSITSGAGDNYTRQPTASSIKGTDCVGRSPSLHFDRVMNTTDMSTASNMPMPSQMNVFSSDTLVDCAHIQYLLNMNFDSLPTSCDDTGFKSLLTTGLSTHSPTMPRPISTPFCSPASSIYDHHADNRQAMMLRNESLFMSPTTTEQDMSISPALSTCSSVSSSISEFLPLGSANSTFWSSKVESNGIDSSVKAW
ncbi:Transcription factor Sox-2 [Dissophora globulifera]|nr:Transcription factor Sox-2 [Dissophora globulifera]